MYKAIVNIGILINRCYWLWFLFTVRLINKVLKFCITRPFGGLLNWREAVVLFA